MSRRQTTLSLDAPDRGLAALHAWLGHEVPPSLDRWLAKAVREGAPPAKRAALGAELSAFLDAAVAWGVVARVVDSRSTATTYLTRTGRICGCAARRNSFSKNTSSLGAMRPAAGIA